MSAGTSVVFQDQEFQKFFAKVKAKSPKLLSKAVDRTTAFSLREIKEDHIPKRTGNLRGSYTQKAIDPITREIFSNSKYAPVIEFGGKARTVRAKPGKRLTIPIKKDVLTSTRSQIKKSSLDKLFRRLKKRRRGETAGDVMQDVGIVLAKKAKIKAKPGQFNIKKKTTPFAEKTLKKEVTLAYRQLGFSS
jgi:hypothetical protein